MKLRELAKAVGMDYTYINKIENDKVGPPTDEKIRKLAAVLLGDPERLILLAGRLPARQVEEESEDGLVTKFLKALPKLTKRQRKAFSEAISSVSDVKEG